MADDFPLIEGAESNIFIAFFLVDVLFFLDFFL